MQLARRLPGVCVLLSLATASSLAYAQRAPQQRNEPPRANATSSDAQRATTQGSTGEVKRTQATQPLPPARQQPSQPQQGPPQHQPPAQGQQQPQAPPAGVVRPLLPQAPFELTAAEEQLLDQILVKWERESDKVKTFKCSFTRWEYDRTFGSKKNEYLKTEAKGVINYKAPDCGDYEVTNLDEYIAEKGAMERQTTGLDHWRCDGKAIFEYDHKNKRLIQRTLPPEFQGKAISDGPLPFVFGAKARQLKDRYWLRDVTPNDQAKKQVWLESYPKRQQDAANFHHATVILSLPSFMPYALQIYQPNGKDNLAYVFEGNKVNDPVVALANYLPLMVPPGWKRVVDPDTSPETNRGAAVGGGEQTQAARPAEGRK